MIILLFVVFAKATQDSALVVTITVWRSSSISMDMMRSTRPAMGAWGWTMSS